MITQGDVIAAQFDLLKEVDQFAEDAAPIFKERRFRWSRCGIPGVDDIQNFLKMLIEDLSSSHPDSTTTGISSGRLWIEIENIDGRIKSTLEVKNGRVYLSRTCFSERIRLPKYVQF